MNEGRKERRKLSRVLRDEGIDDGAKRAWSEGESKKECVFLYAQRLYLDLDWNKVVNII